MDLIENDIFEFIKKWNLLVPGKHVLVACSGGVDSAALLHFMATNREQLGIEVAGIHVDHMLRGTESAEDGVFVRGLCESYGIPFFGGSVPVPEILIKEGGNMQAVCREGRYEFFTEIMREKGYDVLATAHHAEDQLETLLMQITKGANLTGIPIKRKMDVGHLIRPFLPAKKAALYSYITVNGLNFREDPSNKSDVYMRNRFRHNIVPSILKENPAAAEKAVVLSGRLQEDEELLGTLASERLGEIIEFMNDGLPSVDGPTFARMPLALQRRMIPLLLNYLYEGEIVPVEYKSELIGQILHHLASQNGNVSIDLPLGYRFLREYGKITFVRDAPNLKMVNRIILPKGVKTPWGDDAWLYWAEVEEENVTLFENSAKIMYFNLPEESFPLYIRTKEDGDRILLPGMSHPKRLSRIFIDEKVGRMERSCLPVVVTAQNKVCAIPGLRDGASFTSSKTASGKYIFVFEKK